MISIETMENPFPKKEVMVTTVTIMYRVGWRDMTPKDAHPDTNYDKLEEIFYLPPKLVQYHIICEMWLALGIMRFS